MGTGPADVPVSHRAGWGIPVPIAGFKGQVLSTSLELAGGFPAAAADLAEERGVHGGAGAFWERPAARSCALLGAPLMPGFAAALWRGLGCEGGPRRAGGTAARRCRRRASRCGWGRTSAPRPERGQPSPAEAGSRDCISPARSPTVAIPAKSRSERE